MLLVWQAMHDPVIILVKLLSVMLDKNICSAQKFKCKYERNRKDEKRQCDRKVGGKERSIKP